MKGEKIVTILCGAVVTPATSDARPDKWNPVPTQISTEDSATVMAVYLVEGHPWLLLRPTWGGPLAESPATKWSVIR